MELLTVNLGRLPYAEAYLVQAAAVEEVVARRETATAMIGTVFFVEHEPVVTVSRRPEARKNLVASEEMLRQAGVEVQETDRGGDVTYHGPGQIVCYPVLDLNVLNLGIHAYMRLLEQAVIDTCAEFGVGCGRDAGATGVWTLGADATPASKIAACGVRVRKWVSMHGLALNVAPEMRHFQLIVPCGLVGRQVTSLKLELQEKSPPLAQVQAVLTSVLKRLIAAAHADAIEKRAHAARLMP